MALFNKFRKKNPFDQLKNKDWESLEERDELIKTMLGPNGPNEPEQIVDLLFSSDGTIQRAALRRISTLNEIKIVDMFLIRIQGKSAGMIQGVCRALPKALPNGYQEHVLKYLEHKDSLIRRAAEELLLNGPLDKALLGLAEQWLDPEGDERRAMKFMDLVDRGLRQQKDGSSNQDLVVLAERAIAHPGEAVRTRGYQAMLRQGGDPKHLPLFIEALGKESYTNQQLLGEAIGKLLPKSTLPPSETIFPLLASGNIALRTTAVNVIKKLRNRLEILREFFIYSRTLAQWVRDRAFDTLRELGNQLIEPLLTMMEDEDRDLRLLAISLASTLGEDPRMLKPLMNTLQEDNWWIRSMAAETLARIGDPKAIEPLKAFLDDPEDIWIGIDALATLASKLSEQKDRKSATRAMDPLFHLLKAGQNKTSSNAALTEEEEEKADLRIEIITTLRAFQSPAILDIYKRVAERDKSAKVKAEALAAARFMAEELGRELENEQSLRESIDRSVTTSDTLSPMEKLLNEARAEGASDLHISVNKPPMIRKNGRLRPLRDDPPFTAAQTAKLVRSILTDVQAGIVATKGQVDLCYEITGSGRYRTNAFYDHRGINAVFRIVSKNLPTIKSIGLPSRFEDVRYWHQGLMLVCGAAGAGKTTTLAALINLINETRQSHVLTIEDPIEYVHPGRRSLVNQRELLTHTKSYHHALRGALREDPDVIVIGELRDNETVKLAMEAAETGHLVIGTLNCTQAQTAVDRIVGSFPSDEQQQARMSLADSIKAILAQTLLTNIEGDGMVAAFEVIMGLPTVANLIRDNKIHLMSSLMQTGRSQGMQTFDDAYLELVQNGKITADVAYRRATNKAAFEPLLSDKAKEGENGDQRPA